MSLFSHAVWYVRENHDISVSCMPAYGEKYAEARYVWRDHLGYGAARTDFVLFGNGTMLIPSAQLTDSDTFRCRVDLLDDLFEVYTHSIIGKQPLLRFPLPLIVCSAHLFCLARQVRCKLTLTRLLC